MIDHHELRTDERDDWLTMREALWPDFSRDEMLPIEAALLSDRSQTCIYVAAGNDGRLIGFVEVSRRDFAEGCKTQPVGYIEAWYVAPEYRQGGVGRRLIEAAEAWAAAQGCTEMASDTEIENQLSQQAHAAVGYREVGRVVLFYKRLDAE